MTPRTRICHRSMPGRPVDLPDGLIDFSSRVKIPWLISGVVKIHWRAARTGGISSREFVGNSIFSIGVAPRASCTSNDFLMARE